MEKIVITPNAKMLEVAERLGIKNLPKQVIVPVKVKGKRSLSNGVMLPVYEVNLSDKVEREFTPSIEVIVREVTPYIRKSGNNETFQTSSRDYDRDRITKAEIRSNLGNSDVNMVRKTAQGIKTGIRSKGFIPMSESRRGYESNQRRRNIPSSATGLKFPESIWRD